MGMLNLPHLIVFCYVCLLAISLKVSPRCRTPLVSVFLSTSSSIIGLCKAFSLSASEMKSLKFREWLSGPVTLFAEVWGSFSNKFSPSSVFTIGSRWPLRWRFSPFPESGRSEVGVPKSRGLGLACSWDSTSAHSFDYTAMGCWLEQLCAPDPTARMNSLWFMSLPLYRYTLARDRLVAVAPQSLRVLYDCLGGIGLDEKNG